MLVRDILFAFIEFVPVVTAQHQSFLVCNRQHTEFDTLPATFAFLVDYWSHFLIEDVSLLFR